MGDTIHVSGNPLDFSFLGLKKIHLLRKEEARAGKRKPIENSDDEEEKKNGGADMNVVNDPGMEEGKVVKDHKETTVKANYSSEIVNILHTNDISLAAKGGPLGMAGRKIDENALESHKKKKVVVECTSLFLNNNELRNIIDLSSILDSVMYNHQSLQWLDLSYNYLININDEILQFPHLKTLCLNNNYIYSLEEVVKL